MPIILAVLLALAPPDAAPAPAPIAAAPFLHVRLARPLLQGQRILALFDGTRAANPAAALAAYRRAKGGASGLSKGAEAGIAMFNPLMINELPLVDDATFDLAQGADGRIVWNAAIPHDDGSIDALATAMALTDGAALPPLDGFAVDRLGKPGAPLMTKGRAALIVASSIEGVKAGLERSRTAEPPITDSGVILHLNPKAMAATGTLNARRVGESILGLGIQTLDAAIGIEGDTALAIVRGRYDVAPGPGPTIDPKWLDAIPATDTVVAFALAIDPSSKAWHDLFALADRVEKVDPARAGVAPVGLRVGLIFRSARVRPDADLWPILKGVSGFVTASAEGKANGALIRLHTRDAASASRLADETIPRIVFSLRLKTAKTPGTFGFVAGGRTIAVHVRDDSVLLAWGETLPARSAASAANPATSVGPALASAPGTLPRRLVAFWPGRLPALAVPDAQPVVWTGRIDGTQSIDQIRWTGLKPLVKRILDRLPLDPPPDVATPTPTAR
jgi:hypothetical protein